MKKIIKLNFILALTVLLFSSCAVDDDKAIIPEGTRITASLDQTGEVYVTPAAGSNAVVNVVLSETVPTDTQFTYSLNGEERTVRLEVGNSSVPINIPNTLGRITEVKLLKAATLYNTNVELGAQTTATIISVPEAQPSSTTFLLAWENSSLDMDLFLVTGNQNLSGTVVDSSLDVNTNFETVTLDNTANDQVYSLYVNQFLFTAEVPSRIIVVQSDGTISLYSGTVKQDGFVMTFEKSGTDLSSFTQLSNFN